jgi:hypothetical protein
MWGSSLPEARKCRGEVLNEQRLQNIILFEAKAPGGSTDGRSTALTFYFTYRKIFLLKRFACLSLFWFLLQGHELLAHLEALPYCSPRVARFPPPPREALRRGGACSLPARREVPLYPRLHLPKTPPQKECFSSPVPSRETPPPLRGEGVKGREKKEEFPPPLKVGGKVEWYSIPFGTEVPIYGGSPPPKGPEAKRKCLPAAPKGSTPPHLWGQGDKCGGTTHPLSRILPSAGASASPEERGTPPPIAHSTM